MSAPDWNERYRNGDTPWDTGEPDRFLVELVRERGLASCRVLEIGCGTGTNACWLAAQGFDVLGVDLSTLAIEAAAARAATAGHDRCRFAVLDFLEGEAPAGPFDFVFDRGCFHVFDDADKRSHFAVRVAECLSAHGQWLSLVGSTEGPAREHGPPRRSARDVVGAIEPVLEIVELRGVVFDAELPSPAQAWWCLSRARQHPAQPSTRREG